MTPQIGGQIGGRPGVELQLFHAHELRPAEAERAIGMAGLPALGKNNTVSLYLCCTPASGTRPVAARCASSGRPDAGSCACEWHARAAVSRLRTRPPTAGRVSRRTPARATCPDGERSAGRWDRPALSPIDQFLQHISIDAKRKDRETTSTASRRSAPSRFHCGACLMVCLVYGELPCLLARHHQPRCVHVGERGHRAFRWAVRLSPVGNLASLIPHKQL